MFLWFIVGFISSCYFNNYSLVVFHQNQCEASPHCYLIKQDKRKDAVKKVIAAMTVGKDVSSLFTDVVNCMQTENLELKKLVYLYLINYAKSQPDLAILAVNTFVKVRTRN